MTGVIYNSMDTLVVTTIHNQGKIEEDNMNFDHDTQKGMQLKAYVLLIL